MASRLRDPIWKPIKASGISFRHNLYRLCLKQMPEALIGFQIGSRNLEAIKSSFANTLMQDDSALLLLQTGAAAVAPNAVPSAPEASVDDATRELYLATACTGAELHGG